MTKEVKLPSWIYLVLLLVIWLLLRKDSGNYFINKGIVEVFVISFIYISGNLSLWYSRYFMPHVTTNGYSGSIYGRPIPVGDWLVFGCGEALEPVHVKGKIGVLVIPKDQTYRAGRNYIAKTLVAKTPVMIIPPEVHEYLYHNQKDFNLDNVYFGHYSEEFLENNPSIINIDEERKGYWKAINERDRIIEGDNDRLIEMVKTGREIAEGKKSLFVFKKPEQKEEE